MKIVLIGPSGSGKGTAAQKLQMYFGDIPHLSTGDILRQNIKENTPLGRIAKPILDKGQFVGDDIMIELVKNRLSKPDCKNGYILDGFPRSLEQLKALNGFAKLDVAIELIVNRAEIFRRLVSRVNCVNKDCSSVFNMQFHNIAEGDICPKCKKAIVARRDDDTNEKIESRLNAYEKYASQMSAAYKQQGILLPVKIEDHFKPIHTYEKIKEGLIEMGFKPAPPKASTTTIRR